MMSVYAKKKETLKKNPLMIVNISKVFPITGHYLRKTPFSTVQILKIKKQSSDYMKKQWQTEERNHLYHPRFSM